uniref:Uncharacterized protein n=1 Tax=Anguilla anguilla TaxID=7936 RepID=A0A0E9WDJ1_ANGAN
MEPFSLTDSHHGTPKQDRPRGPKILIYIMVASTKIQKKSDINMYNSYYRYLMNDNKIYI